MLSPYDTHTVEYERFDMTYLLSGIYSFGIHINSDADQSHYHLIVLESSRPCVCVCVCLLNCT